MALRAIRATDLVGRIAPGSTVYKGNVPKTVERVEWFGDYEMDVILCDDGKSYPASELKVSAV